MADVQLENGYTKIADEIIEQMAKTKLSPTQYRILFVVWRYTYGFNRKAHELSLTFIQEATELDVRNMRRELKDLEERKIIFQEIRQGKSRVIKFNKDYDLWLEGETAHGRNCPLAKLPMGETAQGAMGNTAQGAMGETAQEEIHSLQTNLNTVVVDGHARDSTDNLITTTPNDEGMLTPRQGAVPATSDQDSDSDRKQISSMEYRKLVADKYLQRRARGFDLSAKDEECLNEIIAERVPLRTVIKGIDKAFDEFVPEHSRDEIRSLSYCVPIIFDIHVKENVRKSSKSDKDLLPVDGGKQIPEAFREQSDSESSEPIGVDDTELKELLSRMKTAGGE